MTCHASARSRSVGAAGVAWDRVVRACLDQLEPLPHGASLGIAYLGDQLAPMADAIVGALRQGTGVPHWLGASGGAALGGPHGVHDNGLAVLITALPAASFRVVPSLRVPFMPCGLALAHGVLDEADPGGLLTELAASGPATIVGGLMAAHRAPIYLAGVGGAGSAVTLGLGPDVPAVAGLAPAGSPLGPPHRVTSAQAGVILALDGRPAFEVMADELGDLFRHAGPRFARSLWLAEVDRAADAAPRVRRVTVADPVLGALRVEGGRLEGEVRLMRPDPPAALERLRELARTLRRRLGPDGLSAGLYLASRFRGRELFGPGVNELALLREELGGVPLIGLVTDAEIFGGGLHEGAGILVLIGDGPDGHEAGGRR